MKIWWLVLMSRSSSDSATTGFGNSGLDRKSGRVFYFLAQLVVGLAYGEIPRGVRVTPPGWVTEVRM